MKIRVIHVLNQFFKRCVQTVAAGRQGTKHLNTTKQLFLLLFIIFCVFKNFQDQFISITINRFTPLDNYKTSFIFLNKSLSYGVNR